MGPQNGRNWTRKGPEIDPKLKNIDSVGGPKSGPKIDKSQKLKKSVLWAANDGLIHLIP